MRFISCYIAGFGKLADLRLDFSKPLTVIKEDNGWGKSTLADFLECMLYGMDGVRSKNVSENLRLKYAPFSGGAYGGALTFTANGQTYRVERAFAKTPAGDTARVYDGNNVLCYGFGEKAEKLGETLLKISRESYRRTAYIAQGEAGTAGIDEGTKGRLIALLSVSAKEGGAQNALERLDNADKALRARRKPAKGKLDEIDERLTYLFRCKEECKIAFQKAEEYKKEIESLGARLSDLQKQEEEIREKTEFAVNERAYREIRSSMEELKADVEKLNDFFGAIDPQTVNTDGLQTAVEEYYKIKEEVEELRKQLTDLSLALREKESASASLSAQEKAIESYESMIKEAKKGEEPVKVKIRKRSKFSTVLLVLALAMAVVGATQIPAIPMLGYALFVGGGLASLYFLFSTWKSVEKTGGKGGISKRLQQSYDEALAEKQALETQMHAFSGQEEQFERVQALLNDRVERLKALQVAIDKFLSNFRFGEIYDYRSALEKIKENVALHGARRASLGDKQRLLFNAEKAPVNEDMTTLKFRAIELQSKRAELTEERAKLLSLLRREEEIFGALDSYASEEEILTGEKARLERRLTAIRCAKEMLVRARETMASKYLQPVETATRRYLKNAGFTAGELYFNGEGEPIFQSNGITSGFAYISDGLKELVGFCTRLALFEALFTEEKPPLILDDPFVNLDDEKTEKGKALVRALSEKYQVLYLTCKKERAFIAP